MNQLSKSVGAGNPHATFCGNRGRATASGDPVTMGFGEASNAIESGGASALGRGLTMRDRISSPTMPAARDGPS